MERQPAQRPSLGRCPIHCFFEDWRRMTDRARFAQQERSLYRHNQPYPLIRSWPTVTPGLEPSLTFGKASGKWLEK